MDTYIPQGMVPNPAPAKVFAPLKKKDYVFFALHLLAAYLLIALGLFGEFHLGFSIAYGVYFAVATAYMLHKGGRPSIFAAICGGLSLAGAVTFALFDDYFVNFIMLILMAGLYTVYGLGLTGTFSHNTGSFRMLVDMACDVVIYPFTKMEYIIGGIKAGSIKSKRSVSSVVGVLVALPVMAVVIALLMHSDAAFENLVKTIGRNIVTYLLYMVMALVITPYLFSNSFYKKNGLAQSTPSLDIKKKPLPASACVSFLGAIALVYVVYLFSQLAYFFSAFKGILPADYHYSASAFARRGFFEMFLICAINILIVSVVAALSKRTVATKIVSCFISLFSVLMIVTAMQKMKLNISIYGMSKNRIMVSVFMLMMLIVIAFFILHIFAPKVSYMQPIIIICSAMFIALSFSDIDSMIAKYNIDAYNSGRIASLDLESIGNLSDSSLEYVDQLIDSDDAEISRDAMSLVANKLAFNYDEYMDQEKTGLLDNLRHYNLTQHKAELVFDDSKYSQQIYATAKLYNSGDYYYNDNNHCFERYLDDGGYVELKYNIDTHCFDKQVQYDTEGKIVKSK